MRICILLCLLWSVKYSVAENHLINYGFSPFVEDGLYGVMYNEEICLTPGFDEIKTDSYCVKYRFEDKDGFYDIEKSPNHYGLVAYKDNGKWGIMTVYGEMIAAPQYDDIDFLVASDFVTHSYSKFITSDNIFEHLIYPRVHKDGKVGLLLANGKEIVAPVYAEILPQCRFGDGDKAGRGRLDYFLAQRADEQFVVFDLSGREFQIPSQEINIENLQSIPDKSMKKLMKYIRNLEKKSDKLDKKKKLKIENDLKCISVKDQADNKDERRWDYQRVRNQGDALRFMMACADSLRNGGGEDVEIAGYVGKMNWFGYINVPFKYDKYEDVLKRDPYNIVALEREFDDELGKIYFVGSSYGTPEEVYDYYNSRNKRFTFIRDSKKALMQIAEMKGYKNSPLLNYLQTDYDESLRDLAHISSEYAERMEAAEKAAERNAKIDAFVNSFVGALNSVSTAIYGKPLEDTSTSAKTTFNAGSIVGAYGSGDGADGAYSAGGDYQSQYDKWADRACKNYNSLTNTGARVKKNGKDAGGSNGQSLNGGNYVMQKKALREAQSQMRKIRRQAAKAGVNIVQSEYETITVSY